MTGVIGVILTFQCQMLILAEIYPLLSFSLEHMHSGLDLWQVVIAKAKPTLLYDWHGSVTMLMSLACLFR